MPVYLPNVKDISAALPSSLQHLSVQVFPTIDSTNTHARRLIANGDIQNDTLLVAHTQTAGKGRLGRQFFSPVGSGLYMTLVCPLPQIPPHITPAAAVATALALENLIHRSVDIKWVNDLYLEERKICGILAETILSPQGEVYILMGIGINITTQHFPAGMRHPAGCILSSDMVNQNTYDLSTLTAHIVDRFYDLLQDPRRCLQNYQDRFYLMGHTVTYAYVCTPDGTQDSPPTVTGVVEGVDDTYRLQLRLANGELLKLGSGEVTHIHMN